MFENITINAKKVFTDKVSVISGIVAFLLFVWLGYIFINYELIGWNVGWGFAVTEVVVHAILSLLFGVFVSIQVYRIRCFGGDRKHTGTGIVGGFFGILVTGCPSCSITIAGYIGLSSALASLPFYGMELKILGVILLLVVIYLSLKNLFVCRRKK